MQYEIVRFDALSDDDLSAWKALIDDDIVFVSPFFEPTFTRVVSQVRSDVRVIVGRDDAHEIRLIWPVQKQGRVADPVGAPFADYHGPIIGRDDPLDIECMLRSVGLNAIRMTGVHDPYCRFHQYAHEFDGAFIADIRGGVDAYFERQRALYPKHAKKQRRIKRKMEREVGQVDFTFDDRREEHFETLLAWKQRQYLETGRHNVLGPAWVKAMLRKLWDPANSDCRGYLHTITQAGRLIAAEYNLGNRSTIHGWVPAYDPEFNSFSPGNMLQEFILEDFAGRSFQYYDLGVSAGYYKKYYADYQIPVTRCTVRSHSMLSSLGGANEKLWLCVEDAHIPKVSNVLGQIRRRYEIIRAAEPSFSGRMAGIASAARNVVGSRPVSGSMTEDSDG